MEKKLKLHNEVEIESQSVFWHWRIMWAELFIFTSGLVVVVYLDGTCCYSQFLRFSPAIVAQGGVFSRTHTLALPLLSSHNVAANTSGHLEIKNTATAQEGRGSYGVEGEEAG